MALGGVITDAMRQQAKDARNQKGRMCGAPAPSSPDGLCHNWAGARTTHKGDGFCWIHDKGVLPPRAEKIDLVVLSGQYDSDPEVLELRNEIEDIRKQIRDYKANPDTFDPRTYAVMVDTLRKLVQTKNQIELSRKYLIPVTVAVNAARRIMDIVAKYLPTEQRFSLRDEILVALRAELAVDGQGAWVDPGARWGQQQG